jgi:hypothetical protein
MTEGFLNEEEAKAIFMEGAKSVMPEKQAGILDSIGKIGEGAFGALKGGAGLMRDFGIYGALAGVLSGAGYNIIKDRVTAPSPEDEFNNKVKQIVANRRRELEDSKWMERVRGMRDELSRNYRKMTPEEYSEKYNALVAALDERRA